MARGKSNLSIADLERMLDERKSSLQKLGKQRADAQRKVDAIDRQILKMGGSLAGGGSRRGSGRARNEMSLVAAMESVLSGKEAMKVGEIVEAVQASGYQSSSANFRGIVNQTLIKERKKFSSPSRGLYLLKK